MLRAGRGDRVNNQELFLLFGVFIVFDLFVLCVWGIGGCTYLRIQGCMQIFVFELKVSVFDVLMSSSFRARRKIWIPGRRAPGVACASSYGRFTVTIEFRSQCRIHDPSTRPQTVKNI